VGFEPTRSAVEWPQTYAVDSVAPGVGKFGNVGVNEGTQDGRGRDRGTNSILRIKEQETRLTLQEHDDDDEEE